MNKKLLIICMLSWIFCGLAAQNSVASHPFGQEASQTHASGTQKKASTYALTDGLVVDHKQYYRFDENSPLETLPQDIFTKLKDLERGTIAIEISTGNIPHATQVMLSCGNSNGKEFFGVCTAEYDHFGVKIGYENGSSSEEDYYSGAGLKSNYHQTILITMDPTGADANTDLGTGGFGAYSFYANGAWQWTTNTGYLNNQHFGFFNTVKNADAIYLGGVKGTNGQKRYPFRGAIHRIRVWDHVLTGDECKSVTSEYYTNGKVLFESKDPGKHPNDFNQPYRIPAIAQAANGNLIAVADYRSCKDDIGHGDIDLHYRISTDNGLNWSEKALVLADGTTDQPYGDAALVADQNSSEVLLLCGSAPKGTTYHDGNGPLKVFRFRSHDYGETWKTEDRKDITEAIYNAFPTEAHVKKLFIASGRITQSKLYKKSGSSYYRIYCVALVKNTGNQEFNAALYSDDFGQNWALLGGSTWPIPVGNDANEAKIEELPDGSVLVSSRISNKSGRNFNIYNYTNPETAEGFWSRHATSYSATNGVISDQNSTNGDVLCVPVIRKSDQHPMYLLLQSLPYGPDRSRVSIFYKPLEDLGNFNIPENVAHDWEGRYQVTENSSAYSVMLMQNNETLGFLYEDGNNVPNYDGGVTQYYRGYNLYYLNLTIGHITDGKYVYNEKVLSNRERYLKANINSKYEMLADGGKYVGQQSHNNSVSRKKLGEAIHTYCPDPSEANYNQINKVIQDMLAVTSKLKIEPGQVYRLTNMQEGYDLAVASDGGINVQKQDSKNIERYFTFIATQQTNVYKIQHLNRKHFVGKTKSTWDSNFRVEFPDKDSDAGTFEIKSDEYGTSQLRCINPVDYTGDYYYLSPEKSGENQNLIAWKPSENWINWHIEPVYFSELKLNENVPGEYWSSLYLPYAVSIPEGTTAYYGKQLGEGSEAEITMSPLTDNIVPAETGVILKSEFPKASLPIIYPETAPDMSNNLLKGTLTEQTVDKSKYYTLGKGSRGMGLYRPRNGKIPRNKAFLESASGAVAYSFAFDLTGIGEIETDRETIQPTDNRPTVYYDLSGRRVLRPTHGIYIVNGQKIYIK